MRLFAYKMTDDTGFAPNPFWGCMTLATCKPQIRQCKGPGDWLAGFTSGELCDDPVGRERLVFLMKVDDKTMLADYFRDERFRSKILEVPVQRSTRKATISIGRSFLMHEMPIISHSCPTETTLRMIRNTT